MREGRSLYRGERPDLLSTVTHCRRTADKNLLSHTTVQHPDQLVKPSEVDLVFMFEDICLPLITFFKICALLCAIFAVMIFAARGFGEAHPQPDQLSELGFGVCNGNPCFMGIVPGVTKYVEARYALQPYLNLMEDGSNY